eukprot:s408_g18.t1
MLWNKRHLAAPQQSRIKPSWCAKPRFRSCSWEHTSLEHAQLPGQKPHSSSSLFILMSLTLLTCMKSTSPFGSFWHVSNERPCVPLPAALWTLHSLTYWAIVSEATQTHPTSMELSR